MKNPPTLFTLVSAALALGLAGLLPAVVCLLVMVLIVLVGVFVPNRYPKLTASSLGRSSVAGGALGLIVLVTAATNPLNLMTGSASSSLAGAASVLAVPEGLPLGLLAALAAGSLIAVTLEIGHRRGTQSALVLGTAVLGLACVAAPSGLRLLVPIAVGWPAALLALTKLNYLAPANPTVSTRILRRRDSTESSLTSAFRWRVVPVLLAIALSAGLAGAAAGSELRNFRGGNASANPNQSYNNNARAWESKFLGGRMNLNSRGPLSETPVAEVPVGSPMHWRTATLDYYNGEGWQVTGAPSLTTNLSPRADGVHLTAEGDDSADFTPPQNSQNPAPEIPSQAPDEDLTNPADPGDFGIGDSGTGGFGGASSLETPEDSDQTGSERTDQVVIRGNGTSQLIAPGRLVSAELPADYAERTFVSTGDRVLLPSQADDTYSVTSLVYPDSAIPGTLGAAATDAVLSSRTSTIDPRYLQAPDNLPQRVRELGQQLVVSAPNRLAAVKAVEARLAEMMSYTLDAPIPPDGQDSVDFALFDSGQGYCEHYASAEVMMLRAAGIPARMVVGYLADGSDATDDGRQVIRQAQAHAWVEVWFPRAGWVTSDPTPPGGVGEGFLESMNSAFNRVMNDLGERAAAFATGVVGPVFLGAVLLVLWVFRRFLLRWAGRLLAPRKAEVASSYDADLRKAFLGMESALAARGAARAENETLSAFRDRIIGPRHYTAIEQKDDLERAFDVLTRALYAPVPPDRDECLRAAAIFDREAERQRADDQPVVSLGQSAQLM